MWSSAKGRRARPSRRLWELCAVLLADPPSGSYGRIVGRLPWSSAVKAVIMWARPMWRVAHDLMSATAAAGRSVETVHQSTGPPQAKCNRPRNGRSTTCFCMRGARGGGLLTCPERGGWCDAAEIWSGTSPWPPQVGRGRSPRYRRHRSHPSHPTSGSPHKATGPQPPRLGPAAEVQKTDAVAAGASARVCADHR